MLHELKRDEFQRVLPLFQGYLQDPMMHAVIEGKLRGRIWVDHATHPAAAIVWTGTECAYLAGGEKSSGFKQALQQLVLETIMPAAQGAGCQYLSLFSFPESYAAELEALLSAHLPLKTPLSTFAFDEAKFHKRYRALGENPGTTHALRPVGAEELATPQNAYLAENIVAYWGTVERFLSEGCGYCVLDAGSLVSWCYVQAYGRGAQTLDIWTAASHRRQGLGTRVGAAVIERSLAEGYKPFWICDKANVASRKLAERLGFHYAGDTELVDIPFEPYGFYASLAQHFFLPNGEHRQAAEAYERAFGVRPGEAEDYYHAARAWALAGEEDRAQEYVQKAITSGWTDMERIAAEPALAALPGSTAQAPDDAEC